MRSVAASGPPLRALLDKSPLNLYQPKPALRLTSQPFQSPGPDQDFWFLPEGAQAQVPVRWKQAIVTWTAIYPLATLVPMLVVPLLRQLGLPSLRPLDTLFVSITLVALMVYVVMPNYTKLVQRWLFK